MSDIIKGLKEYFATHTKEEIQADWDSIPDYPNSPTIKEFLELQKIGRIKAKNYDALQSLSGKKVRIITDVGTKATLVVESVKEVQRSVELEPATSANDWWPATRDWTEYKVTFTNGYSKTFQSLSQIKFI